jgi:hypothetical protein
MRDDEKDVSTDFLVARPSFWSGVGRLLDLWGKFDEYNTSRTTEEADMRALYSDWRITGQDLRDSWFLYHGNELGFAASPIRTHTSQRNGSSPALKKVHGRK